MKKWLIICLLLFAVLPANAVQKLNFDGFIADEAHLLSDSVKQNLNMTIWDLQKKSGADIAVVTLQSLDGQTVEQAALEIGRKYKIGSKEKNNGVVFLTAVNERRMRIELGYGLEDKISMRVLENIRDNDILPYYKKEEYGKGISRGTYKLVDLVAEVEGVTVNIQGTAPDKPYSSNSRSHNDKAPWWAYVLAVILAPFRARRRYGSGGFGGGGGFGGSGCSGSW